MERPSSVRLTEMDVARLRGLVAAPVGIPSSSVGAPRLESLLEQAVVVPSERIRPDVVTMNSLVVLQDVASGSRRVVRLVYPGGEDDSDCVSVLSPLGQMLLGARIGEFLPARRDGGEPAQTLVADLVFQPEANGRFDL